MVYWFAEFSALPIVLQYGDAHHAANQSDLSNLVAQIAAQAEEKAEAWPLTDNTALCRFCTYRSLCDRGVVPGRVTEWDIDAALDLSFEFKFDDIEEIEY